MNGVEPPQTTSVGELICDAVFRNPVLNTIDWYISMDKVYVFLMIRLKQFLQPSVYILMIDLLSKFNKK